MKPKINPLSRVPRQQRLVMAIRGGAGVGKSHFIRSMSEAGLGKLCIFDTERKSRLLKGVGVQFDALEIESPDELPELSQGCRRSKSLEPNIVLRSSFSLHRVTLGYRPVSAVRHWTQTLAPICHHSSRRSAPLTKT